MSLSLKIFTVLWILQNKVSELKTTVVAELLQHPTTDDKVEG